MIQSLAIIFIASATQDAPKSPVQLKPYAEVVTAEAKTEDGLFKVHQIGDKFLFELPREALDKDMLWQAQEKTIPSTLGSPGVQDSRLVRWTRRGNRLFLMGVDYTFRSLDPTGIERAIPTVAPPAILESFTIQTEGSDGATVIDVTDFLLSDPPDLNVGPSWNAQLQRPKSYIHQIRSFPKNVEMHCMLTFRLPRRDPVIEGTPSGYGGSVGPFATLHMRYSFLLLPEKPMTPRYRDPRIGYFGIQVREFGGPEHRGVTKEMIKRFRLEKRDASAAISDPVKPITFYLSPDMPKKWRPWAIKAVEAWQPAFEQAGFSNAILAREAPTPEEDPEFDTEDARYSLIRWTPASIENAFGLAIVDPRSGEIISGQVVFYHNFLSWLQNTYFAQVSPLDPRAHRLPFSDELTGELLQFILTHEVGHSLGLEHNMKASSAYTIANLRDQAFVRQHDIASSIMDYARFNYVAQPGDGVPLARGLGAYDRFAIEWGYKPSPSPEAEPAMLAQIAARQNTNPFLRFGNYLHLEDPFTIGEDLGGDPIATARLGFANLRRTAKLLVPAAVRPGQDYRQLSETYAYIVRQHSQLLDNVIRLVGGVTADDHRMMAGQPVYTVVPAESQRAAVRFMCGPEGVPPTELLAPEIVNRLYPSGDLNRRMSFQNIIVFSLFSERRVLRMFDQEASLGSKAYSVAQLLDDVTSLVWRELASPNPQIDLYERSYQRGYLTTLDGKLNGSAATRTDLLTLGKATLRDLARRFDKAIPRAADRMTALHLAECRREIESILKGTSPASKILPLPAAPPRFNATSGGYFCLPGADYASPGRSSFSSRPMP